MPVVAPFCASPFAVLVYRFLLAEKNNDGGNVKKVNEKEHCENVHVRKSDKRVIPVIFKSVGVQQFKVK